MHKIIQTPLDAETVMSLQAGDSVLINGEIYTARDAAHKKLSELLDRGEPLPINLANQVLYYAGPCPAKPGQVIGPVSPTTSGRVDAYTPRLLALGVKGMIGKGLRSPAVIEAMRRHQAVYFAATGGAAALLAKRIKHAEIVAYPELGPEAIHRLEVADFPAVVVIDAYGNNLYEEGRKKYSR